MALITSGCASFRLARLVGRAFATVAEAELAVWSRLADLNGGRELRHAPDEVQVSPAAPCAPAPF